MVWPRSNFRAQATSASFAVAGDSGCASRMRIPPSTLSTESMYDIRERPAAGRD